MINSDYSKFIICKDKKGNVYEKFIARIPVEAVFCLNRVNFVCKGTFNISARKGSSPFGEQLVYQFIIDEKIREYPSSSEKDLNNVEIYFSKDFGINFLKDVLGVVSYGKNS